MLSKKSKFFLFLLSMALLTGSVGINLDPIEAATATYHVKEIEGNGTLKTVGSSYSTFKDAKNDLDEKSGDRWVVTSTASESPLKIVAMKTGYVQSYPYRKGSGFGSIVTDNTLNIYNKQGTSARTYIPAHYKMFYHDTVEENGRLIAKITIQGAEGYVDITKTDLIPMFYVDKEIKIELGGKENYYSPPEKSDHVLVQHDVYTVNTSSKFGNEMTINYSRTYNTSYKVSGSHPKHETTYGQAPSWLKPGKDYYSKDGIHFFTDPELKKVVKDGSKPGKYYAYFQWLPIRSISNYTATNFYNRLRKLNKTDSVMYKNEQAFIESGNKYGMNSLLLFAQASLESDYGTSTFAKDRYNLFGWNAVDSNPDLASGYDGVFTAVEKQMSRQISGYFDLKDWRHEGLGLGNKASGVTVRYASDPYYGIKVAGVAYITDRNLNFIDHNTYNLGRLDNDDGVGLHLRKKANASSGSWGVTKGSITDDIRTNLGTSNGFIKTNLPMVVKNGSMTTAVGTVDLTKEFGYMTANYVSNLPKHGKGNGKIPTQRVIVLDDKKKQIFETTDNLNLRNSWSTSGSLILTTIPKGTGLKGHKTNNGWVKVTYNKQSGYVHADYLKTLSTPEQPNVPVKPDGKRGDLNGDNKIDIRDMMVIRRHILKLETLGKESFKAADLNNDKKIDIRDMMIIRRHILKLETID